jgi:hypothetical protein
MRMKCIGCDSLARLIYHAAAHSPHIIDVSLFQLGLHIEPTNLQMRLQAEIDATIGQGYDAIVMGYALCGKATDGLIARDTPVVIPKAHDCITLFLGSRSKYNQQQNDCPGTYWYVQDYIERGDYSKVAITLGTPQGMGPEEDIQKVYESYVEKYGKDNADYLMEVMGAWQSHYERAAFINMNVGDGSGVEQRAREQAERRGWRFEKIEGDMNLILRLLNGDWDHDYLILQPGQKIKMTYDENVMGAE